MPKKVKSKGKGKPKDDKDHPGREQQGAQKGKGKGKPKDDKDPPGREQQGAQKGKEKSDSAHGAIEKTQTREQPPSHSPVEEVPKVKEKGDSSHGAIKKTREPPPSQPPVGDVSKGKEKGDYSYDSMKKTPTREQPPSQFPEGEVPKGRGRGRGIKDSPEETKLPGKERSDSSLGAIEKPLTREPPPSQSTGGAVPKGRGRGRGRRDTVGEAKRPGDFFAEKDTSTVKIEEYPELPSAGAVPKQVKDVPCRPKASQKMKLDEELIPKFTGLSIEQKPAKRFKMAEKHPHGNLGTRIELYVNYFKLSFKNTDIYHYDIDILEATKSNKMGRSLMSQGRTAKEDIEKNVKHVERQKRRNIGKAKCRQIISQMIKSKLLQKYCPVYDGQKNLFTSKPLPFKEKISFPVDVRIDNEDKIFYVAIQPVEKQDNSNLINMQPLIKLYSGHSNEIPDEVLLVYNTIMNHREHPFHQVQFRNSFFPLDRENVSHLGSGLEIWFGYHQSVHLTEQGPVVIINLAAKAFHKAGSVIDYAYDVLGSDITKVPKLQNWEINNLSSSLKGVQVKVTHQKHPRKYKIRGLTKQSAKELLFDEGNRKKSVAQYFLEKYGKKLLFPHLPCLQMQTNNNTTFIPMETCVIVEGQPKIGKLSGELTSKMIKSTAVPPRDRFQSISYDARNVNTMSKPYLDAFGLIMDVNLLKVDGRVIAAPQLAYGGSVDDRSRIARPNNSGVWRVEDGKKFYKVVVVKNWVLISFADDRRFGDLLGKYCDFLVKSGNKCGMKMEQPRYVKSYGRNARTEDAIAEAKERGAQFAIVVLNRRDNFHTYDEVKFLADFKYGLVTQCMEDRTLSRINDQITTNVCLKINVKLGGINHILLHKPQVFSENVMVMGADAIHWTRGLGYPSIVSVVASVDRTASRYALTCHTQRNEREGKISQEIIRNMKDITLELLEAYEREARALPSKIIVFRDGVSDGQFQHALEYEVSGIQEASQQKIGRVVPITFICVQKRHQTRLRPVDPRQGVGKHQNVPPGTVVDKTITHPVYFDYFVCSHEGIQGTSKPAHYTVLHNDNKYDSNELQQLCYFLCHTYVRCTRSVSLPAPVMYADLAAFRAKKYADFHIHADDITVSSEDTEREFPRHVEQAIKSMKNCENNMFYV